MSYSSSSHKLQTISSFAQAKSYFESQPQRKGSKWLSYQRPLRDDKGGARLHHYRIENRNDGKYYDIVLYNTVMARFYEPEADGAERRLYMGHDSQTSHQFMWHVLYKNVINYAVPVGKDDDDNNTVVPIYHIPCKEIEIGENIPFSLEVYVVNDKIDISRSRHTPHYVRRASKDDRQHKANILKHFDTYVLMAMMRLPEYEHNVTIDYEKGRAFGGDPIGHSDRALMQRMLMGEPSQEEVEQFFQFGQCVFDVLASKRAMNQKDFTVSRRWYTSAQVPTSTYAELEKKITPEEFRKSFHNKIAEALQLGNKSTRVEIPQFVAVKDYPRTAIRLG